MAVKLIQLSGEVNGVEVEAYPYVMSEGVTMKNGKKLDEEMANHKHKVATFTQDGFMSKEDKVTLNSLQQTISSLITEFNFTTQDVQDVINSID